MKILVFDDKEIHRQAALAQLADHDVTVVGTYDEAQELLVSRVDWDKNKLLKKERFGDYHPSVGDKESSDPEVRQKYTEFYAEIDGILEQSIVHPDFDVVLTDLIVPASKQSQGEYSEFVGQEMPVGVFIALLATVKGKVRYVGLLTDVNHHYHPGSACIDEFNSTPFTVDGCKVVFENTHYIGFFYADNLARPFKRKDVPEGQDYFNYKDSLESSGEIVKAKDWVGFLELVLKPSEQEREDA